MWQEVFVCRSYHRTGNFIDRGYRGVGHQWLTSSDQNAFFMIMIDAGANAPLFRKYQEASFEEGVF